MLDQQIRRSSSSSNQASQCASNTNLRAELPNHFQSKLYFSRGYSQLIDRAGAAAGGAIFIEECAVVYRRQKSRVVEYIKELRPNLDVEALGDPPNVIVLEDGEIQIVKAWPDYAIASHVAH